jgi:glycosyltransferase involved in cell wall biosynthesis
MISVIIPALNEEEPIAGVVAAIPRPLAGEIIVVDNGSTDATAVRAEAAGARVVSEPKRGYGAACWAGVQALSPECTIVVFLDGDGSDCAEFMDRLVAPIQAGTHDFVIGSRTRGKREPGSMNTTQLFAGWFAGLLMRLRYGVRYTDMGPFRAIRRSALETLDMRERTFGWNIEMQMMAAHKRLRILELPVDHRCRTGGESKVTGNLRATARATVKIASTFLRIAVR